MVMIHKTFGHEKFALLLKPTILGAKNMALRYLRQTKLNIQVYAVYTTVCLFVTSGIQ